MVVVLLFPFNLWKRSLGFLDSGHILQREAGCHRIGQSVGVLGFEVGVESYIPSMGLFWPPDGFTFVRRKCLTLAEEIRISFFPCEHITIALFPERFSFLKKNGFSVHPDSQTAHFVSTCSAEYSSSDAGTRQAFPPAKKHASYEAPIGWYDGGRHFYGHSGSGPKACFVAWAREDVTPARTASHWLPHTLVMEDHPDYGERTDEWGRLIYLTTFGREREREVYCAY